MTVSKQRKGLCFRCDWRARFLESGRGPRSECKGDGAVWSCYMYRPVMPVILAQTDPKDKRPQFGPAMISARSCYDGTPEDLMEPVVKRLNKKQSVIYWTFKKPDIKTPEQD